MRVIPSGEARKYTDTHAHTNRQYGLFIWLSSAFVRLRGDALVVGSALRVVVPLCFYTWLHIGLYGFHRAVFVEPSHIMAHPLLDEKVLFVLLLADYSAVIHIPNAVHRCVHAYSLSPTDTHTHKNHCFPNVHIKEDNQLRNCYKAP